jgi:molybdate transport system substrate-binding protein
LKALGALMFALAALGSLQAVANERVLIAAAADLKFSLDQIVVNFRQGHPGAAIDVSYGSSGNFAAQIRQNAPFDLFFSADVDYPRKLGADGFAASSVVPYAVGRIVLWSASLDASKLTLADLDREVITRIAIANPRHAPYGRRAQEALESSGMWDKVQPKLVLGENIAQTAQFVQSGSVQVGIIALSLACSPALASKGAYYLIPDSLHMPLEQAFIVTRHGAENPLAKAFADYMQSPAARDVMRASGFSLPGETSGTLR